MASRATRLAKSFSNQRTEQEQREPPAGCGSWKIFSCNNTCWKIASEIAAGTECGGKKSGSWRASDAVAAWTAVIGMPKYVLWATCGRQMFSSYPTHTPCCFAAPCHGSLPFSATLDVKQFVSEIKQTIKPIKRDTRSTVFSQ